MASVVAAVGAREGRSGGWAREREGEKRRKGDDEAWKRRAGRGAMARWRDGETAKRGGGGRGETARG
jgi:hypothetical protein